MAGFVQHRFEQPLSTGLLSSGTPDFRLTLNSMFNLESPIRSAAINKAFGLSKDAFGFLSAPQELDERFDPMDRMLKDNDLSYFRVLHEAKNEEHYNALKEKAIWETGQKELIAEAGFGQSIMAGLLVGSIDPLNLAVGAFTGGSTNLLGAVYRSVGSAIVATGINEALLQQTQVDRTWEESAMNIVGDMILSTAFGMGGYGIARSLGYNPKHLRDATLQEYMNSQHGLPFVSEGGLSAQLGIRPQTRWGDRAQVIYETSAEGAPAARYDPDNHTIFIDKQKVSDQFKEHAWRKPRMPGVTPLRDSDFTREGILSEEAWFDFVHQHEYLHTVHKRRGQPGAWLEDLADYENRINDYALLLLEAGSFEGVAHTPVPKGVHKTHADSIHEKYDKVGEDGVRETFILDQMIEEGGFGHAYGERHPSNFVEGEGIIEGEGVVAPERMDTEEVINKAKEEEEAFTVDQDTGYSEEQYFGVLAWTTKLVRAMGLEKIKANPMLHGMNSLNAATRLFTMWLVPTPMNMGNIRGHTTPGDVATASNSRQVEIAEAMARNEKTFIDYRLGSESGDMPSSFETLKEFTRSQVERIGRQSENDKTRYIREFRERVSRGMRSGDVDENPVIEKQIKYLREVLDNLTKEAEELGVFGELEMPTGVAALSGAKSFLPRVWLQDILEKNFDDALDIIVEWQVAHSGSSEAPEYMASLIANPTKHRAFVRNQLISVSRKLHSVEDFDIEATDVAGTFKGRSIWIDDNVLAGENRFNKSFLDNDVNSILKRWMPQMHTDIELTRKFGSVGMERQFANVRELAVRDAVKNKEEVFEKTLSKPGKKGDEADEVVKTTASAEKDIEKLSAMRDIMRGVYSLSSNPLAISSRFARLLTDMTHLSLMGNVMVSSIPDTGRILMVNRMAGLETLNLAFTDFKRFRTEMKSMMRDIGVGLDMALSTTVQSLVHQGDIPRYTGLERFVGRLTDIQFVVNLLNPWNAVIKQTAGIATVSRIIKDLKKYKAGKLSPKHAAKLSAAGVNEEFMERLLALHEKYGERVKGVEMPNASLWDLDDADFDFDVGEFLLKLRRVVSREVDMQIVTPGAGDIPLSLRKTPFTDAITDSLLGRPLTQEDIKAGTYDERATVGDRPGEFGKYSGVKKEMAALYPHLGRMFGIYKSFIAGSWGRVLIPSLQNKDSSEIMGAATMIILGGMVKSFKDISYDRPGPEGLKEFLLEGFDQAGLGSWFMFANSQGEALLDTGLRPLLGMPRFEPSLRWQASSVLGASAGQLIRAGRLAGDVGAYALGDDFSSSSATNAIRMLPGQSLFYLRLPHLMSTRLGLDDLFGDETAVGATQ